jgi:hypothetical protein
LWGQDNLVQKKLNKIMKGEYGKNSIKTLKKNRVNLS